MQRPQYRRPVRNLHMLGLAAEGADVNARRKREEPALVWAADYGTPAVVKALLARGAEVDATNWCGLTGLQFAVQNGRGENARLLLAAGAKVEGCEEDSYTPLMDAYDVQIATLLIRRGADVNARARDGWTPLFGAILNNKPDLVALLLQCGADLHARNAEGETPLLFHLNHLNSFSHVEDLRITQTLLSAGANVQDCDKEGNTPLSNVRYRLRYKVDVAETIVLLLEAGAVASDSVGAELLAWARRQDHPELVRLLLAAGVPNRTA